ncbi:MAG: hypothetical protein HQK53_14465 [Oligoflexia bacterium]|nr:hypothetical protein [Oligoflexia bacterium]
MSDILLILTIAESHMKIKRDWWLANSLINILSGIIFIVARSIAGMAVGGLIIGAINILIGIALLQKSKIVFWIVFIVSGYSFIQELLRLSKQIGGFNPTLGTGLIVLNFVFAVMLWQQIKNEKVKK